MSPNEVAIRREIGRLAAAYSGWTPARSEAFAIALSDLWPEDVEAAVLTTLREWKAKDGPAPGYVRDHAMARRGDRTRATPRTTPTRGPVAWHEARLPMSDGGDGYMRDADGRYVMLQPKPCPERQRSDYEAPNVVPEDWEAA